MCACDSPAQSNRLVRFVARVCAKQANYVRRTNIINAIAKKPLTSNHGRTTNEQTKSHASHSQQARTARLHASRWPYSISHKISLRCLRDEFIGNRSLNGAAHTQTIAARPFRPKRSGHTVGSCGIARFWPKTTGHTKQRIEWQTTEREISFTDCTKLFLFHKHTHRESAERLTPFKNRNCVAISWMRYHSLFGRRCWTLLVAFDLRFHRPQTGQHLICWPFLRWLRIQVRRSVAGWRKLTSGIRIKYKLSGIRCLFFKRTNALKNHRMRRLPITPWMGWDEDSRIGHSLSLSGALLFMIMTSE